MSTWHVKKGRRRTAPKQKNTSYSRSYSSISSVSTASIGATKAEIIPKGEYRTTDFILVRPYFKCQCYFCNDTVPFKGAWGNKCEKSFVVERGTTVQVTDSKVLNVGGTQYSVGYIQYSKNNIYKYGWVLSEGLKSTTQPIRRKPKTRTVQRSSRSRSPSVVAVEHPFNFGDLVEVQVSNGGWRKGEVKQKNPLTILVEGTTGPQRYHPTYVRNCVGRQFIATQDLIVRKQKYMDNWGTQILKAGTQISIFHMDGYEGRITSPVQGWISMRTAHSVNVMETNFKHCHQKPTIIVKNLPADIYERKLHSCLTSATKNKPVRIELQRKSGQVRALVTVASHEDGMILADQKILPLGQNEEAALCWDIRYLKNVAATKYFGH